MVVYLIETVKVYGLFLQITVINIPSILAHPLTK